MLWKEWNMDASKYLDLCPGQCQPIFLDVLGKSRQCGLRYYLTLFQQQTMGLVGLGNWADFWYELYK